MEQKYQHKITAVLPRVKDKQPYKLHLPAAP